MKLPPDASTKDLQAKILHAVSGGGVYALCLEVAQRKKGTPHSETGIDSEEGGGGTVEEEKEEEEQEEKGIQQQQQEKTICMWAVVGCGASCSALHSTYTLLSV